MPSSTLRPTPGRVLCFAPHPDDEILGCGGTLCLHVRQGDAVLCAIATDGTAGDPDGRFDASTYAATRRDESRIAARELGFAEPRFWGLPDSCEVVESDKLRVIELAADLVRELNPDIIYLPWSGDDNPDHLVLHEVVVRGLRSCGFSGEAWGYEVWAANPRPDLVVDITEVQPDKQRALAAFATQLAYSDLNHPVFGINAYRSLLIERSGGYGEGFERVTP